MGRLRMVSGAVAAALAALATAAVLRTAPAGPSAGGAAAVAGRRGAAAGNWTVQVDGWYIEVDRVAPRRPAPLVEIPPAPARTRYDALIGKYAEAAGLDWRLIAALIFEESGFEADAESEAGAYGLMQVRPVAAAQVGERAFREPEANIRTGVRYLQYLDNRFAPARGRDRLALMLAAYNMGPSHVEDAQLLAQYFGYDPYRWDGAMEVMVSLLEEPQIFAGLPNGYARGREVVAYVDRVLARHAAYRRRLPAVPPSERDSLAAVP